MERIEQLKRRADNGEKITYDEYLRLKRDQRYNTADKTYTEWDSRR